MVCVRSSALPSRKELRTVVAEPDQDCGRPISLVLEFRRFQIPIGDDHRCNNLVDEVIE
jgi:hypothetical protein